MLTTTLLISLLAAAGCAVGPAAHRAGVATTGPAPTDTTSPTPTPTPTTPTPVPEPDPAPTRGAVTVTAAVPLPSLDASDPAGAADDVCCVAQLPGGDLLVGTGDAGTVYRLASATGHVTHVGPVWEVTLGADHELLGLAVDPSQPGWLYVSYAQTSGLVVARHSYDPTEPPGEQLGHYPHAFVRDIPADTASGRAGGALAFGPDGMLYAGTGDGGRPVLAWDPESPAGKVLRMTPFGEVPDDNPDPGSFVYSRGHVSATGLAWDAAGRLWVADTGPDGVAVGAVVRPGGLPFPLWESTGDDPDPARGLVYAAGALWLGSPADASAGGGLWRLPLDGVTGLAWPPEHLPLPSLAAARVTRLFPAAARHDTSTAWALTATHAVSLHLG